MASPQNQSSPTPQPPFDIMHNFFNPPLPSSHFPPSPFPPTPSSSSSLPPPTAAAAGAFPFTPQHIDQIHPQLSVPPPSSHDDPLSQLLIHRSVSFPTPPLNPNPNSNAGAHLMALLNAPQLPPPASAPPQPLGPVRLPSSKVPRGRHLSGEVQPQLEEAFTTALERRDVSIVSWLCSQVDLRVVLATMPLPLSQVVLLSLLQQLACDINNEPARKLAWMIDVTGAINPRDPMIAVHVRPIFEQVYQILIHQRSSPTLGSTEQSSICLLMHIINSMLMTYNVMEWFESLSLEDYVRAVMSSQKQENINNKNRVVIKKMGHYRSDQSILLVGEGDFSFSACLARAFGHAPKIVATSWDSRVSLESKYSKVVTNLKQLKDRGCTVLHGVDAHTMFSHQGLVGRCFDRVVFNFPHIGFFSLSQSEHDFVIIWLHQVLVRGFINSAKMLLSSNGQVHITHKTSYPFNTWGVTDLARQAGMRLFGEPKFDNSMYPGYENKMGSGYRCNGSFPIGACKTFMFVVNNIFEI